MTEYVPPHAGGFMKGYHPNTETVTLELHRLLSIFLSSKSFAELRTGTGEVWEPIAHIQEQEEDEITRILLAVAITARVMDDREDNAFTEGAGHCGTLTNTGENQGAEGRPLTLREACNKIIHAQKVRFDISETEELQTFLNPVIYLYGDRRGVEWKATLDVIEFAKQYVSCTRYV